MHDSGDRVGAAAAWLEYASDLSNDLPISLCLVIAAPAIDQRLLYAISYGMLLQYIDSDFYASSWWLYSTSCGLASGCELSLVTVLQAGIFVTCNGVSCTRPETP
jgi:hypothetical protein